MKTKDVLAGICILTKYMKDPDRGYYIGAEHDQLYFFATDMPVKPDDLQTLLALGWFQEDGADPELGPSSYNQEEAWTAYV